MCRVGWIGTDQNATGADFRWKYFGVWDIGRYSGGKERKEDVLEGQVFGCEYVSLRSEVDF